jgi:hypothetical protein
MSDKLSKWSNFRLSMLLLATMALFACGAEKPPPPAEETFIGEQVKALRRAEDYDQQHLDAIKERQDRMEQQLEEDGG